MDDERLARLAQVLAAREARRVARGPGRFDAAVAVIVRAAAELELLFIRRSEREGDPWSGHVAFPGGRRSADDPDLAATALRETEEETGIRAERAAVLGALDEVEPATPRLPPIVISPWVVAVPPDALAVPNPAEVVDALWVPLSALRERRAVSELRVRHGTLEQVFPSLVHGDYTIWGLTHRIVTQFLEIAARAGV